MNNVDTLEFNKVGKYWEVTDAFGRKAKGITKEMAVNNYRAAYKLREVITPDLDQYKYGVNYGK